MNSEKGCLIFLECNRVFVLATKPIAAHSYKPFSGWYGVVPNGGCCLKPMARNSIYKRFDRWNHKGVWEAMHHHFADEPDMEAIMIDSTAVRAHACAAGAKGGRKYRH